MLNPSDIAGKKFDKGMGRGYKAEEVDAYLNQVADEMNDLIAQNRDLEHKMMVLADKLEEYKQDEESLRSALIGAQKLGDSVVREAKAKAASIVEDAKVQAGMLVENAKHAIEKEQNAYIRLQREVATFKSKLQLLYKQHLELISSIPVDQDFLEAASASSPAPEPQPVYESSEASEDYDDQQLPAEDYADDLPPVEEQLEYTEQKLEYTTEDRYEPEPQPERPAKRESRFGPLKFGKEFDIRRDDDKRKK
ncbi:MULTISPECIES: DivIVA domain-containing protein [Anaerotruncus]|uniref:DivIVA domain-containing protein n=2 Tax=Oscillospiraceae TaxID=216572 RepID=UPI00082D04A5|nr:MULTISPECIES: DivIVA domain-containing protein [Anaerotruncus]RGX56487.1 DivIVA domain-containing protein [Anaerotruncus sp. AF02-27]